MFKPHTSIRSAVATTLVSALFVSLSAHAGLLGIGGSGATGAAGGVIGNTGPANFSTAGAAASQAAAQTRVQSMPTPQVPSATIAPPSQTVSGGGNASGTGRADFGGALAGEARSTQAAIASTGDNASFRAQQTANRVRTGGEFAMDQAAAAEASAAPRSASVSADGSTSGTAQASGRKGSVNGSANANATVSGSANY